MRDTSELAAQFANQPKIVIMEIDQAGKLTPWFEVDGWVAADLVVNEVNLFQQVVTVAAKIQFWGAMTARARRAWESEERDYRIWRDGVALELSTKPKDAEKGWKKPAQATIDQMVRTRPEYKTWYLRQEKAAEAARVAESVLEGFRALKDILRSYAVRVSEDSAPRLSI